MADSENACPDSQLLMQVLDGTASDEVVERVEAHLGECPDCVHRLESIGPQCLTMLSRMRRMMPDPASSSPESVLDSDGAQMQFRIRNPESIGPYRVIRKIGQGAMGEVFECQDDRLNRRVAVKTIIRPNRSEDLSKRITTEARLLAGLNHPNIVTLYEFGSSDDGTPFLVMELVEGETLKRRIRQSRLSANQAAALTMDCALAIAYAHECGVLHRDLKPSNILLANHQTFGSGAESDCLGAIAKIADFGLAKSLEADMAASQSGTIVGTPAYLAPEMIQPGAVVSASSDIYALGIVLYECVAGEPPFKAGTFAALVKEIEHSAPDFDQIECRTIPDDLRTIIEKCLEKRPEDRYMSARDLASDLELFLAGRPIHAKPVPLSGQLVRWCRREPILTGSLVSSFVLMVTLVIGSIVFAWRQASLKREAQEFATQAKENERQAAIERDFALDVLSDSTTVLFQSFINLNTLKLDESKYPGLKRAKSDIAGKFARIAERTKALPGIERLRPGEMLMLLYQAAFLQFNAGFPEFAMPIFDEIRLVLATLPHDELGSSSVAAAWINSANLEAVLVKGHGKRPADAEQIWRRTWDTWMSPEFESHRRDMTDLNLVLLKNLGWNFAKHLESAGKSEESARIHSEIAKLNQRLKPTAKKPLAKAPFADRNPARIESGR